MYTYFNRRDLNNCAASRVKIYYLIVLI